MAVVSYEMRVAAFTSIPGTGLDLGGSDGNYTGDSGLRQGIPVVVTAPPEYSAPAGGEEQRQRKPGLAEATAGDRYDRSLPQLQDSLGRSVDDRCRK